MIKLKPLVLLFSAVILTSCGKSDTKPLVLTSVGPVHSLTSALLADTSVEVKNLPDEAQALADQASWFSQESAGLAGSFDEAGAVVSISSLWSDPLASSAQQANSDIINIDASAFSSGAVTAHSTGEASPYFWLSPTRVTESSKMVADQLAELYPDYADQIQANQQELAAQMSSAASDFEGVKTEHDLKVFGLSDAFAYMTTDLDIPVVGYLVKADADWTVDDHGEYIKDVYALGQPTVIHNRDPDREIGLSTTIGGGSLIVLNDYESSTDNIVAISTGNLNTITTSLTTPRGMGGMGGGGGGGGAGGMGGGEFGGGGDGAGR